MDFNNMEGVEARVWGGSKEGTLRLGFEEVTDTNRNHVDEDVQVSDIGVEAVLILVNVV